MNICVWKRILHKKRPAPLDDYLQEASPCGWSFARGRYLQMIIWEFGKIGVWEYQKYWVIHETSGFPLISGDTRYFGLPAAQWFSKLNRVGYQMKYWVSGRVRVPAGHWCQINVVSHHFTFVVTKLLRNVLSNYIYTNEDILTNIYRETIATLRAFYRPHNLK